MTESKKGKVFVAVVTAVMATVVAVFLVSVVRRHLRPAQRVYLKYSDSFWFMLGASSTHPAEFTSARVTVTGHLDQGRRIAGISSEPVPIGEICNLVFHWRGHGYPIGSITTNSVLAMGGTVGRHSHYPSSTAWSMGSLSDNGQDYYVGFEFWHGGLVEFQAQYGPYATGNCPFEVSANKGRTVAFPTSEEEIAQAFGPPPERYVEPVYLSGYHPCINNLRKIDGAKEQWAMATGQQDGALPRREDISMYLKGGWEKTKCHAGGRYSINAIGQDPTCPVPGHNL